MKAAAETGRTSTGAHSRWYQPRSLRGQLLAWLAPWVVVGAVVYAFMVWRWPLKPPGL